MRIKPLPLLALVTLLIGPCTWAAEPSIVTGARLNWILNCQGCHGMNGRGAPGHVGAMENSVARFLSVDGGREFLIRVPGVAFSPLGDQEVADLMNWLLPVLDPAHLPADFVPYTVEEVARLRRPPFVNVPALRARLIAELERSANR